jgi:hypothetical protein
MKEDTGREETFAALVKEGQRQLDLIKPVAIDLFGDVFGDIFGVSPVQETTCEHGIGFDSLCSKCSGITGFWTAADEEKKFDGWWKQQVANNDNMNIGADYKHWARKGFMFGVMGGEQSTPTVVQKKVCLSKSGNGGVCPLSNLLCSWPECEK